MDNKNGINIELSPEMGKGVYSNLAIITHSPNEFVADFVQMMPGMPKAQVVSRVILTPENAKRLCKALEENIAKFEDKFGEIALHQDAPAYPIGPASNTKS